MKYILLHGMGQNASSWNETISFLPNTSEIVCPELSDFFSEGNCYYSKMYTAFCDNRIKPYRVVWCFYCNGGFRDCFNGN